MKIADLKKNIRVLVRVPAKMQDLLGGGEVKGTVQGLTKVGNITWVEVKIPRKGIHRLRPQDLQSL